MSSRAFEKLLHNSRNLIENAGRNDIPPVQFDLGLLDDQSTSLYSKHNQQQKLDPTTHYFLAQGGIDVKGTEQHLKKLESIVIFKPSEMIKSTDIESYLRQKREKLLEGSKNISKTTTKKESQEVLSDTLDLKTRPNQAKMTISENKLISYAHTIRDLNQRRLLSEQFPLVESLKQLTNLTNLAGAQGDYFSDIWDILACLTDAYSKRDTSGIKSRDRQCLIEASKSWLEKKSQQNIESILFKYAAQVRVGGLPLQNRRILAYIRFMYKRSDNVWSEPYLELQNDVPIWLYVYTLMKTGYNELALEFVEIERHVFDLSPNFPSYFKEYFDSPDRLLSENSRKMILAEYQQMEYGIGNYDLYKKLVYKIIGRCEMNHPVETKTKEDDLWIQLSLLRESSDTELYSHQEFRLKHLQNILNTKTHHSHDEDSNPWSHFITLLLSLQFERAIDFLYKYEAFKFEATHFAIVFAYYGLLQNVRKPHFNTTSILSIDTDDSPRLDFGKLIQNFVDVFIYESHTPIALEYFYLATLYPTKEMTALSRQMVVEYVVQTKDYKSILGINRVGSQGFLQPYKPLLGIQDERDYATYILSPVAKRFQEQEKFTDSGIVTEIGKQ